MVHQVQRIFQLIAYKAKQESLGTNLTHTQLAELYSTKVTVSSGETVSRDYVGAAVTVYSHILSDVACRTLVLQACPRPTTQSDHLSPCSLTSALTLMSWLSFAPRQADETFGKKTPWDSLTKLESVVKRARENGSRDAPAARKVLFQLQAVNWYCLSGTCHPTEMSISSLVGKSRCHRGLLDIILFKMDVLHDWLTVKLDACQLSHGCKSRIRASMADFEAYRLASEDCTWRAPLAPSGQKFADIMEAHLK
jgi:hypothetical protein